MYPVYYLTRRMILAATCVYLDQSYAQQWVIWMLLSFGMLFLLAKISPHGDTAMNVVQIINEAFIFVALLLLMPLANNLTDLSGREDIGWCLYFVVLACIVFNILILLVRSCGIFCEYLKARADLVRRVMAVELEDLDEDEGPGLKLGKHIEEEDEPGSPRREIPMVENTHTFGFGRVKNSIESLYEYGESVDIGKIDRDRPSINPFDLRVPPYIVTKNHQDPLRSVARLDLIPNRSRHPRNFTNPIGVRKQVQEPLPEVPSFAPEAPIQEPGSQEPNSLAPASEPLSKMTEDFTNIDSYKEQMPELEEWNLHPLIEGLRESKEPACNVGNEESVPPEKDPLMPSPEELKKQRENHLDNKGTSEIIIDAPDRAPAAHSDHKDDHDHDKDHDCPVCNAAKPRKPTAAIRANVAASVVLGSSIESGVNSHGSRSRDSFAPTEFRQNRSIYQPMMRT